MTTNERLFEFPSKATPVATDIIYLGDSAAAFDEKNSTIAEIINVYPSLTSLGGITLSSNKAFSTDNSGVAQLSATLPAAVQQAITQLGAQGVALNMNSNLINNVADPVSAQDAATRKYVDQTALNGTSVYAASAATLGTVLQAGAGVGATLTNAGAQATFALDGVNPPVGSLVLIKNTATGMSAANEGIYSVTNVGSGATNWVLTRASSYDTPTEINNTGLIVIQNGSTLVGTAWYNAATIVTVDTTNFSYSQFGNITFPISIAHGGTNAITAAGAQTNLKSSSFFAYLSTNGSNVTGDGTQYVVAFDSVRDNTGSNFNTSTFTYTAPASGSYSFSAFINLSTTTGSTSQFLEFVISGNTYSLNFLPFSTNVTAGSSVIMSGALNSVFLSQGATVKVNLQAAGITKTVGTNAAYCSFSGIFHG